MKPDLFAKVRGWMVCSGIMTVFLENFEMLKIAKRCTCSLVFLVIF